ERFGSLRYWPAVTDQATIGVVEHLGAGGGRGETCAGTAQIAQCHTRAPKRPRDETGVAHERPTSGGVDGVVFAAVRADSLHQSILSHGLRTRGECLSNLHAVTLLCQCISPDRLTGAVSDGMV